MKENKSTPKPEPRVLDSLSESENKGPFTLEEEKDFQREILKDMKPVYDALNSWRSDSLACDIRF